MSRLKIMCQLHKNVEPNSVIQFPRTKDKYFVDEHGSRRKVEFDPEGQMYVRQKLNKKERRRARHP